MVLWLEERSETICNYLKETLYVFMNGTVTKILSLCRLHWFWIKVSLCIYWCLFLCFRGVTGIYIVGRNGSSDGADAWHRNFENLCIKFLESHRKVLQYMHAYTINCMEQYKILQELHLVCQRFKDSPKQFSGQMQLLLWRQPKVAPTIREAIIFPTTLIVIG